MRHGNDPRRHASLLEPLDRDTARRPARSGWFERCENGAGSLADSEPTGGDGGVRRLATEDFLPLLLREDWPKSADRDLVADYLNWWAPFLVTLPVLDDEQNALARRVDVVAQVGRVRERYTDVVHEGIQIYTRPDPVLHAMM